MSSQTFTAAILRSDQISASFDNCARSKTCSIVEKGAYDFNQHIIAMNAKETRDVEFVVGDAAAVQAFWQAAGVPQTWSFNSTLGRGATLRSA